MQRTIQTFLFLFLVLMHKPGAAQVADIDTDRVIRAAAQQLERYLALNPDTTRYPRSLKADGTILTVQADDWTSGFFAGNLWYLYQLTGDKKWIPSAMSFTTGLESQKTNTGTHDLGFMLYNSYGHAYQISRNAAYKDILLAGAGSLTSRYNPRVGAIRSWDRKQWHFPVIVDNLMNLEYLFWATQASGDSLFHKTAVSHADTDLKYRFRTDYSSWHVLEFDERSGSLMARKTHQGLADESCWARGQAWAIYGYTVLYRYTKDLRYLRAAVNAANLFLSYTGRIPDHIPYWDFNALPGPATPRDASAAAVASSALFELSKYIHKEKYRDKATALLKSLCSPVYFVAPRAKHCFLLQHSTGHKPGGTEIDVPLVYADYYFLEAIYRYKTY
ncbi:glycoside hydrolase family 88 protein [Pedobacter sp. SYP-B3415]|uniref:glycoside hydrolase family 88 protein n=1 Tax=Pedobacter sp. SYP-B3415 TaxID=2496641 RepID=UPI00197D5144|nr:glycoside hydrolase family 88 protein [Pedobacter sp. SYP-B3415]